MILEQLQRLDQAVTRARRAPWAVLAGTWVCALAALAWWLPDGTEVLPGLAVTPALACAAGAHRRWVPVSGALALAALGAALADGSLGFDRTGPVVGAAVTVLVVVLAAMWTAARRTRMAAELDRTREIATAAQQVLLRPLPYRVGVWNVAGEYVSASRGARVGGDFYEVLATPYGVRALIGDARGHGLPALGLVAALLGSFREAAHQERDLAGVLHRLDGALGRHLRDRAHGEHPAASGTAPQDPAAEEFATVQLVQLADDGVFQAVNCGHPQPYLLGPRPRPLPLGEPLPPLGLFEPQRTATPSTSGRIGPGEGLLLYTDGLPDARDPAGRFFSLPDALPVVLGAAAWGRSLHGPTVAAGLRTAVRRHTGGRVTDDMAVLVLVRNAARTPHATRAAALLCGAPYP